jgi:sigma-B regulation protein RsbU (phosphoserine phosphatase)
LLKLNENIIIPAEFGTLLSDLQKHQKELDQSLKYASYIQKALFPKADEINSLFPDNFLIFLPRDIVSGDFYWVHQENDKIIVAVGDSTGHGVPGAFISILGISYLNLVFSKHKPNTPAQLLNYLREYFMKTLNQTGKENEQKDGIDMSVCFFDKKLKQVQFAGAFNPVYIVRNNSLVQLEGDKMPIGVSAEFENSFNNKQFELEPNDMVYLFSDGFPDQFGGPDGKKYKYNKFRELLIKCSNLPVSEQKVVILDEFTEWKGNLPQLDDMTMVGIKI